MAQMIDMGTTLTKLSAPSLSRLPISISSTILLAGLFLLFLLAYLMSIPAIGFFFGLTITPITLMVAILLSIGTLTALNRHRILDVSLGSIFGLIIMFTCCLIIGCFYDFSWDSDMYHKLAIHALGNGWNPLVDQSEDWQQKHEIFEPLSGIWIDHYSKGVYFIAASFYTAFGNLEAGKAYTLILMIAITMILGVVLKRNLTSTLPAAITAIVTAFNPITCAQMLAFYNDAFLVLSIAILICGLAMYALKSEEDSDILPMALIACGFIMCTETKFTGLAYGGLFSLSYYVFFTIRTLRKRASLKRWLHLSVLFVVVIFSSVVIFGYTSYVMNLLDHGNPLYPLMGEGAVDIVSSNEPYGYAHMNNLEKLFYSYFGVVSNDQLEEKITGLPDLKVPFTFSLDEIRLFANPDIRISGFGPIYSGILVVQIIILIVTGPMIFRWNKKLFEAFVCYAIPALVLLLFISESWWARYSGYQYLFNVFALIFLFVCLKNTKKKRARRIVCKIVIGIFSLMLAINSTLILYSNASKALRSTQILNSHIEYMQALSAEGKTILVNYWDSLPGVLYALTDNGIDFELVYIDKHGNPKIHWQWPLVHFNYTVLEQDYSEESTSDKNASEQQTNTE